MSKTAQPTRYDRWMFGTMNDGRTAAAHATRARRRGFVAAHIALTAVASAAMALTFLSENPWWLAALLAAAVAWFPVTGVLNAGTRGLLELRSRMLDERQLAERGEVFTRAHRVTLGAMTAALLGFFVAGQAGVALAGMASGLAVTAFVLLVLHWLLPLWIAALRVPDTVPDEVDDALDAEGAVA